MPHRFAGFEQHTGILPASHPHLRLPTSNPANSSAYAYASTEANDTSTDASTNARAYAGTNARAYTSI